MLVACLVVLAAAVPIATITPCPTLSLNLSSSSSSLWLLERLEGCFSLSWSCGLGAFFLFSLLVFAVFLFWLSFEVSRALAFFAGLGGSGSDPGLRAFAFFAGLGGSNLHRHPHARKRKRPRPAPPAPPLHAPQPPAPTARLLPRQSSPHWSPQTPRHHCWSLRTPAVGLRNHMKHLFPKDTVLKKQHPKTSKARSPGNPSPLLLQAPSGA